MISVSIIEDNDNYRTSLVNALSQNSAFKISGVYASGEEALVSLEHDGPDIAVVDIGLKCISGIQLIAQIRGKLPNTQFLICSSHQNNQHIFNALKAGASGYVAKGSSIDEIQQAIIELYAGSSSMSTYIARKVMSLIQEGDHKNYALSDRELEVLSLFGKGLLYKEISATLGIAINTVKNHCRNIYKGLHIQNNIQASVALSGY